MSRALDAWLAECRERITDYLDKRLPPATEPPARLHEAMRYAVLAPGKYLRPALAFGAAAACGRESDVAMPVAAAVELVHAYSLVHDDLPAMDDDEERRGRPTLHVKFDEATAILAGDALLALGFELLAEAEVPSETSRRLAVAAGSRRLVGGQIDDLELASGRVATRAAIESVHRRKTCALFEFAVVGAGIACRAPTEAQERLARFADHYGLAFQAVDDLLDCEVDECSILQVTDDAGARAWIAEQRARAYEVLEPLGERASALRGLAEAVAGRLP
jgi:geranylgeranyl pyrophosphate synthase